MGESLYCAASRTAAGHLSFDQHSSALTISRAAALSVSTKIATQLARATRQLGWDGRTLAPGRRAAIC